MALADQIPGYAEALAAERQARQEAWLPVEEPICGVEVLPLTLRHAHILTLAGSPYLTEGDPGSSLTLYDIALLLWVVSPEFVSGDIPARDRYFRSLRHISVAQAHAEIEAYLARAFFDLSAAPSSGGPAPKIDWITGMIHRFASVYGWSVDYVFDRPIRQLVQLSRAQSLEHPETAKTLSNPLSDAKKAAWLESINTRN